MRDLPSSFRASAGPSVIFHKYSVRLRDLPSTCVNFSCIRASEIPVNIPCGCGPFGNFPCIHRTFRLLVLTFCASARSSVNFSCGHGAFHKLQVSMHLQYFLSCSVYSLLIRRTIRPLSIRPRNFSSNIRTSAGPSVNFHQLSVHLRDLPSTCVTNLGICGTSQKILCGYWSFRQLQSTFRAVTKPFVNFPFIHESFSQLSMPSWGLRLTFRVSTGLYVNIHCGWRIIHQLFVRSQDSLSNSVNFLCVRTTLCQFYMCPWDFREFLLPSRASAVLSIKF